MFTVEAWEIGVGLAMLRGDGLTGGGKCHKVPSQMKTATVRDLRYDFPKIEAWLEGGEEILITKHSKPIARLSGAVGAEVVGKPVLPDFEARRQKTWGDRFFSQKEVEEMRAFETGEP